VLVSHLATRKSSSAAHTHGAVPSLCWFRVEGGIRRVKGGPRGRRSVADRGLGAHERLREAARWEGAGGIRVFNPQGAADLEGPTSQEAWLLPG
jgi:hypothetical protein